MPSEVRQKLLIQDNYDRGALVAHLVRHESVQASIRSLSVDRLDLQEETPLNQDKIDEITANIKKLALEF